MIGTIVNTVAVLIGASIGFLLKKGIPARISDGIMKALGLCTVFLGISGSLKGNNSLILIISMVVGTLLGELVDLDVAEGFVSASLLFCVGAMTIVGALQAGLTGDCEMLYNKSMLDFTSSIIFTSTLGIGVFFSAAFVLVYQGAITLLAQWVAPLLTDVVIAEMTCVGSVIIIGIGLNLLGITKLKVMNFVPAIFLPILLCSFM